PALVGALGIDRILGAWLAGRDPVGTVRRLAHVTPLPVENRCRFQRSAHVRTDPTVAGHRLRAKSRRRIVVPLQPLSRALVAPGWARARLRQRGARRLDLGEMTCHRVPDVTVHERRLLGGADVLCLPASGPEPGPAGWVDGA